MIISDLMKGGCFSIYVLHELEINLDCCRGYAYFSSYHSGFQRKMQVAFEEVRAQIANMNSFVQERVTGMKIVQLY
jgi:hypothetical protein